MNSKKQYNDSDIYKPLPPYISLQQRINNTHNITNSLTNNQTSLSSHQYNNNTTKHITNTNHQNSNKQSETSYNNIQHITQTYNPDHNNISTKQQHILRVATINVRGLNTPGKNNDILALFKEYNTDFLILTETKLSSHNAKYIFPLSVQYRHIHTTNNNRHLAHRGSRAH